MTRKIGFGAVSLLVLASWGCGSGEAEEVGIQAVAVQRGNLRITAEATGTVEPVRRVEVKSKASGEITRLHGDVGDVVQPGALLAEIDPRDVRNRYDQAVAELEVAQAQANNARAQAQRSEELHAAGVITDQELENARLQYTNSQASLTRARTNLELAELQLGDVTIRAPMAGTILEKNVEEGTVIQSASQNVSGGTTLFVMASLDQMQVRTLVDETDMGEIQAGQPTSVRVEAFPNRSFMGVVEKIEPQAVVQQNVTKFPVIISLANHDGVLRPGMNAEVEVLIDEAMDVLLLSNTAIVLPQDAVPAAMALGLPESVIDLAELGGGGFARGGGRQGGAARSAPPDAAAAPGEEGEAAGANASEDPRRELQERMARGEISPDSVRAVMQAMRGGGGGGGQAFGGGRGGAAFGAFMGGGSTRSTRRAVVFVVGETGTLTPRGVEIGLNDWDRTEIVSGLEEGEQVALVGAAQLQAQQQAMMNRMRSGGLPFGGGMGGGRGRF